MPAATPKRPKGKPKAKSARTGRKKKQTSKPFPHQSLALGAVLLAALAVSFYIAWSLLDRSDETPQTPPPITASADPVNEALADMGGLPYEENLSSPIEDGVKQADYALLQAMRQADVDLQILHLDNVELRRHDQQYYHFQTIRFTAQVPDSFLTVLKDSLTVWAGTATLEMTVPYFWRISVHGVTTHELNMLPHPPDAAPQEPRQPERLRERTVDGTARLVIVMDDLGQSRPAVKRLLALSYPVTFAIWPGSSHAKSTAEAAYAAGREVIIHQPMEPLGYPSVNPGPAPLLVSTPASEIRRIVAASAAKVPHATGLNNHMGSRFTTQATAGLPILVEEAASRGFFILDSMTHPASLLYKEAAKQRVPYLKRDVFLDVTAKREDILRQLRKAERVALLTGSAVAIGHPLPETLAALEAWQTQRNTQVRLVRLSDLLAGPGQ